MGIFDIFHRKSKKEDLPALDLSLLKTEVHSHFIPAIDDGVKTKEEAVELIKALVDFGYSKVITTPHVISDSYRNTPAIIYKGLEEVKTALSTAGVKIEMDAAAEYYLDADLHAKVKEGKLLTFGEKYVLFEVSYLFPPESLSDTIFSMQLAGYIPVLAHPERYNFWHGNFKHFETLVSKGVLLQLNINSVTGYYSPAVKRMADDLIERGMISFLGSDCHHKGHIDLMQDAVHKKSLHRLVESGDLLNHTL